MTIVAYGYGLVAPVSTGQSTEAPINDTGIINRNLSRRINQTMYALKRKWGGSFVIYQMGDATVNSQTGVRNVPQAVTPVRRGIIMPAKTIREAMQTISVISANKTFVSGGSYDSSTKTFIVDRVDAPNLDLTESDWIVYDNRRFEVKEFQEFEFDSAWVITGKAIEGEIPEQIRLLSADNLIRVEQDADQT